MLMKGFFTTSILISLLAALSTTANAQGWKAHNAPLKDSQAHFAPSEEALLYLGYAKTSDVIYPYDGLSVEDDSRVGCAMVLTPNMLRPYAGGEVVGMVAGWDTYDSDGSYECFVRKAFHGDKLAGTQTAAKVGFGWNTINFDQTYTIPNNPDSLLVGFYCDLQKDVIAIPTLYPHNRPGSCFLWREGETDDSGRELWQDASDLGTLPVILIVKDKEGKFTAMVTLESVAYERIGSKDSTLTVLGNVRNNGSGTVTSLTVSTKAFETVNSHDVKLSQGIESGQARRVALPMDYMLSGPQTLSIDAVNGKANTMEAKAKVEILAVPKEVADRYTFVPLVEYFESENSYMSPRYYEEILAPGLADYKGRIIQISQHMGDRLATGNDDATVMALDFCNGDSMSVELPCMGLDRSYPNVVSYYTGLTPATPLFSVLYPEFAKMAYDAELKRPTFASVGGSAEIDGGRMNVTVNGDIAKDVMPDGAPSLRLTVYLMERSVESDTQEFWSEEDKEEHQSTYTHPCVIRKVLSDGLYGDAIDVLGDYNKNYTTDLDPEWNADSLYVVAFINRGLEYSNFDRQVINSAEIQPKPSAGIDTLPTMRAQRDGNIYDLAGRRVAHPTKGVYVRGGRKFVVR